MSEKTRIRLLCTLIAIIFAVNWPPLMMRIPHDVSIELLFLIGLVVPFGLLVGVVWYRAWWAYYGTLAVFILAIIKQVQRISYHYDLYLMEDGSGRAFCSCCPECEMKRGLQLILGAGIAIVLMVRLLETRFFSDQD